MATTQNDNRAKFLELRKQGISVADARNQTYGPPPVVADATPVTPSPIAPITNQEVQQGVNAVGGTAEQRRQTRANITAGQTIALPPAPTSVPTRTPETPVEAPPPVQGDTAPVTPKVDATPGITQDAFQQAKIESEKIKAQNEAQMKLNTQQADLKAQERQQVAQETAKANTPVNQKDVLNALVSGVSVAPQNTAAYRNAQMQYKTYQKFATMTPTQLVDNMKMGEIGTETAQLLASNPNYIKAKEDFDKFQKNQSINNMIKSVAEGATGKTTAVDHYQNASDAIAKKLGITETNADAFARIVSQDPETLQLTKTVSNIAKQLNTLNTERNAVYEDLKKQYPDLSASAIMTLMAGRTKEATAQIDALNSSLTLTQADLKMAMEMAKAEYDATKEDITLQAGLAKEDRAMQNALDLSQAQFDQKLAQQAQLTNDPTTAITTMIDEYKKLGIPFTRSTQQVIADFQASGKDLPTYLSELQGQIQSKPEYKTLSEYNKRKLAPPVVEPTSKWGVIGKNADGTDKYGFVDASKGTVTPYVSPTGEATGDLRYLADQFPNQAWAKNNNPAGITWNSNFDKGTGTAKLLVDAGIKFEKGTARPAKEGGNYVTFATIEDGLRAQQIMMTQTYGNSTVGNMLSSWVGTSEGPNYAKQVAGMAGITDLNQKVSALSPEQVSKLQMAKIQKESPGLAKLLTQPTTTPTNANQYTDQNINDLAYLVELQEKNPTQAAKDMKELGYSARDLANYKAGNVPMTEKQKNSSTEVMNAIKDLADPSKYEWNDAVGFLAGTPSWSGGDAANATMAIDNLVAKLTLPNLGVLKGPMSDKDIQFIKEASSKLSRNQSDASFERNLIDAYNLSARRAGMPEITKLSDISGGTQQKTAGGELDYSKYE